MLRKRFIPAFTVLLAIIMVLPLLAACSANNGSDTSNNANNQNNNNNNPDEIPGDGGEDPADSGGASAREQEIIPDYLPDEDYGGYEFNVLVRYDSSVHYAPWEARDIFAEEETGDPINDSVYKRNRYVEDKYNCVITQTKKTDYNNLLKRAVNAGEDTYDLFYANLNDITGVAANGYFYDLMSVPNIDLSKPWWDQNAQKSLSIANILFFCPSNLIIMHNDCTSAIVFNKELIKDYSMEDPYKLVKDGKWTVDRLIAMSKDISKDVNGDGIMNEHDMYGYACYRDSSLSLMHGAGGRIAQKDPDDLPVLTLNSEVAINALNKAFDLMYAPSAFNVHKELEGKYDAIYQLTEKMFIENRALFYWILLHDIEQFRNMDADFGIIPIPKYSETQKDYGCTVNQYHGHAVAIPVTVQDIDRTSVILESLTAKSRYTLLPAYYDISMQRKFTRDEESADMLDIIFDSQVYDLGAIYNFGGYSWDIIWMTMSHNRDIVSLYEKKEKTGLKDIDRITAKYVDIASR